MTQTEYITLLFAECGFDTAKQRSGFMTSELGREVKFSDELDSRERHRIIEVLKDMKSSQRYRARADWSADEDGR